MIAPWDRRDKVINYGDQDDLTMLAAFETKWDEVEAPRSRLEMLAKRVGIPVVSEYPIYTPDTPWETFIPNGEEGFVLRFEDGQRIKVKSGWYMRWHRIADEVTYNRVIALIRFENQTLDQVRRDAPSNIKDKLDDILSHVITTRDRIEVKTDEWWDKIDNHDDYAVCAELFKQAGREQHLLFARMKGHEEDYNKRLWQFVRSDLAEEGADVEEE